MKRRLEDARILMYSHDTFGLGHLRRLGARLLELDAVLLEILAGARVIRER